MSLFMIGLFGLLALAGIPVAVSLGAAAMLTLLVYDQPILMVAQFMYTSVDSFLLVAIPLFILAGHVMEQGRLSEQIFGAAEALVGRLRGGLGHVNIVGSFVFGGISGSAVADVASLGPLEIRAMTERGYPREYSAALTMITATLASIVPPSILMIIVAAAAGESIGAALAGGLGPALLLGGGLLLFNGSVSRRRGFGAPVRVPFAEAWRTVLRSLPATGAPIIILGGMFSGVVTPTEAAGLAVLYTVVVARLFYRSMPLAALPALCARAGRMAGTVLLIMMTAGVATYVFTVDGLPARMTSALLALTTDPDMVMLLTGVALVVIGMFMDIIAASLILVPILLPAMKAVGVDPLHFVVYLVCVLSMGLATPPVGSCLFATAQVSKVPIERLAIAALPMYAVNLVVLVAMALFPAIILWPARLLTG